MVGAILFILWMTGVIAAYFVVHRPWTETSLIASLEAFLDLSISLAIVFVAGGIGQHILSNPSRLDPLEIAAIAFALGAGIISAVIMGLGLLGLLQSWVAWLGLIGGLFIFRLDVQRWAENFAVILFRFRSAGRIAQLISLWIAVVIVLGMFQALAPPLKWDSLVYHLELPKQYLGQGRLVFVEDNLFVGSPQLVELLYTWTMALHSGTTATVLGWFASVISILGLGGLAYRVLGDRAMFLAPAILLSGESIASGIGWGYVDFWVLLFGLGMLICLDLYFLSKNRSWLAWGGVLAGFAFASKYSGAMLILLACILLVIESGRERLGLREEVPPPHSSDKPRNSEIRVGWGELAGRVLLFILPALLVVLPWALRNWAQTGNPFHPFSLFGVLGDPLRQEFYVGVRPQHSVLQDISLPLNATFFGVEGAVGFNTSIGGLMLALIPGVLFGISFLDAEKRGSVRRFSILSLSLWLVWAIGSRISGPLTSSRLYLGAFPSVVLLSAVGFEAASKIRVSKIRIEMIAASLVGLSLLLQLQNQMSAFVADNPLAPVLGLQSASDFRAQELGWYEPVMSAINKLPADTKVQLLWEPRAYYCEFRCSPDVILDRWWYLRRTNSSVEEIRQTLIENGVTHVLIFDDGVRFVKKTDKRYVPEDWSDLDVFVQNLELVRDFNGIYSLYTLGE